MAIGGHGLSNPGPGMVGVRAQPSVTPVPNSTPVGAQTGAPPRTQFRTVSIPGTAVQIVAPTPENRVAVLTAPNVGFSIYIGGAGVTPATGLALPPGLSYELPLPGLQEVYAVTDAPVWMKLRVAVSVVLMAEQARPVGRIGNE